MDRPILYINKKKVPKSIHPQLILIYPCIDTCRNDMWDIKQKVTTYLGFVNQVYAYFDKTLVTANKGFYVDNHLYGSNIGVIDTSTETLDWIIKYGDHRYKSVNRQFKGQITKMIRLVNFLKEVHTVSPHLLMY